MESTLETVDMLRFSLLKETHIIWIFYR
jgi:hypothetical protein